MMLQKAPTNEVQHLQEELIAVKLREAEATLSMKELRQRVNELERSWEVKNTNGCVPGNCVCNIYLNLL